MDKINNFWTIRMLFLNWNTHLRVNVILFCGERWQHFEHWKTFAWQLYVYLHGSCAVYFIMYRSHTYVHLRLKGVNIHPILVSLHRTTTCIILRSCFGNLYLQTYIHVENLRGLQGDNVAELIMLLSLSGW